MRVANPYANLHALLDTTRRLDPEEMAELHLEQGFVDRALAIYVELTAKEPDNTSYQTRRAWLARMLETAKERETTSVERSSERDVVPTADTTLIGALPPRAPRPPTVVRPLRIVRVR